MKPSPPSGVGTCACERIHPPSPPGATTSPPFCHLIAPPASPRPPLRLHLAAQVAQCRLPHHLVEPVVHADAAPLARLLREVLRLRLHAFELTQVARAVRPAAGAGDLKVEVAHGLALADAELDQVEDPTDDP